MISKTALQAHYSCSMEKNGFRKTVYVRKMRRFWKLATMLYPLQNRPLERLVQVILTSLTCMTLTVQTHKKYKSMHVCLYFVLTYEKCVVFSLLVSQASVVNIRLWGTKTRTWHLSGHLKGYRRENGQK